jgi:hypothetical protein
MMISASPVSDSYQIIIRLFHIDYELNEIRIPTLSSVIVLMLPFPLSLKAMPLRVKLASFMYGMKEREGNQQPLVVCE